MNIDPASLNKVVKNVMLLDVNRNPVQVALRLVSTFGGRNFNVGPFVFGGRYQFEVPKDVIGTVDISLPQKCGLCNRMYNGLHDGKGYVKIDDTQSYGRSIGYSGIGLQAARIAIDLARENGLEQRVGLTSCFGSGHFWLKLGFLHTDVVTREQFLECMRYDGVSQAEMYLPPENAQKILEISQNPELLKEFYAQRTPRETAPVSSKQ